VQPVPLCSSRLSLRRRMAVYFHISDASSWQEEAEEELDEDSGSSSGSESLLGANQSALKQPWQRAVLALTMAMGLVSMAAVAVLYGPHSQSLLRAQPADDIEEVRARKWRLQTGAEGRKGSFLVLGDWGWDAGWHGNTWSRQCQETIAAKMAEKQAELGDVKFVVNVGDSFYPFGVQSRDDPQWEAKWRGVYSESLRSIPWYSVYGNHDYVQDPCACSDDTRGCAQVNANISDLSRFYMPSANWFKEHPELDLEVIGMDLNTVSAGDGMCDLGSGCASKCKSLLHERAEQGFKLFADRSRLSAARNLLVFSHYPTDYFGWRPDFINGLKDNSRHHIEYFGGHRHGVDQTSTLSTWPNNNWVVGGGGGFGCDGNQGFVVGEIDHDSNIRTYSVLVDSGVCCQR